MKVAWGILRIGEFVGGVGWGGVACEGSFPVFVCIRVQWVASVCIWGRSGVAEGVSMRGAAIGCGRGLGGAGESACVRKVAVEVGV